MAAEKSMLFNILPAAPRSRCSRTGVSVGYAQVCCEVGLRQGNTPKAWWRPPEIRSTCRCRVPGSTARSRVTSARQREAGSQAAA